MASQWFYQVMGNEVGPISGVELRDLAQRGTISRDTLVKNAPDGIWASAERVNGLFAASSKTPPAMPVSATVETKTPDSSTAPKRIVARRLSLLAGLASALLIGIVILLGATAILLHARHSTESLQEARAAFKAVKQLQARTEIGLTYTQYVDAVGTAWAEVSSFVESPTGKTERFCGFSGLIKAAMDRYKDAIEPFGKKRRIADPSSEYGEKMNASYDNLIQFFWKDANMWVDAAERCLNEKATQ